MRIRLTVTHTEGAAPPQTYVYDQPSVTLGRAPGNDLVLEDETCVVSKRHAEIGVDGDRLTIRDLGSKNYTFLDGDRIAPGAAYGLSADTDVAMGPFRVAASMERAAPAEDLERTVFAPSFINPFKEDAEALAEIVGRLRRTLHDAGVGRAEEALDDALGAAFGPGGDAAWLAAGLRGQPLAAAEQTSPTAPGAEPAAEAFAPPPFDPPTAPPSAPPAAAPAEPAGGFGFERLAGLAATPPPSPTPGSGPATESAPPYGPPEPAVAPPARGVPDYYAAVPASPGPEIPGPVAPGLPAGGDGAADDGTVDTLVAAVARLVSIPGQFRHEFIGQTVVHTPETAFLFEGDAGALRAYLAQPGDRDARLRALGEAAEAVAVHQVAMLEGYRAAARDGAAALLDAVDPDAEAPEAGGGLDRLLPGSRDRATLDAVKERIAALRADTHSGIERRHFRPAFVQAYLDRTAGY